MTTTWKKVTGTLLTLMAAVLLCIVLMPQGAQAAETVRSGNCGANGDNITWKLDNAGNLTISGNGEMADYSHDTEEGELAPWYYIHKLGNVIIEPGVTDIGKAAFYSCELTSISIPDTVTRIRSHAFENCGLTIIEIPGSVKRIGDYAFRDSFLTGIMIPESVTRISEGMFYHCEGLTEITLPNSITDIGYYAFQECRNLTSINIPTGVTSIGYGAFYNCRKLAGITIPDGVTIMKDGAFHSCWSLRSVTIPEGVTNISDYTFDDCRSLTEITIPEGVTSIGDCAFENCSSLEDISIPKSVTSIGINSFSGCNSLKNVSYAGTEEQWHAITISDGNTSLTTAAGENTGSATGTGENVVPTGTAIVREITPTPSKRSPFEDVPMDSYYYEAVLWAAENGITSGTSSTTFSPKDPCTRAQMVTFLWNMSGKPETTGTMPFTDVREDAYYYKAVLWAYQNGITSGTSSTTFSPAETCTRGQAATFVYCLSKEKYEQKDSGFSDVGDDAYYAVPIAWLKDKGITSGTSDTTYGPNEPCRREQIVQFLWNYSKVRE